MSNVAKPLAGVSAGITDFKANPNAALKASGGAVVAALKSNQPCFYAVPPKAYERMLDALEDQALLAQAEARLSDGKEPVTVSLNDL